MWVEEIQIFALKITAAATFFYLLKQLSVFYKINLHISIVLMLFWPFIHAEVIECLSKSCSDLLASKD